ncbi:hypothetical protein O7632_21815 [Solwaraspora sp. WMMD406]|uniref:hypothetical protein n=1 Tax=Solwaraspora sp. WMMD406 TaxID=3016095 RepID=UPI002415B680|nr:hypothetical protein [Solwaraspora sp. WMMD406]MDG4766713.1 hypothetical protein [Solwaraspora sp. WMMD406]
MAASGKTTAGARTSAAAGRQTRRAGTTAAGTTSAASAATTAGATTQAASGGPGSTPRRGRRTDAADRTATGTGTRSYRRAPDDLGAVFAQLGTTSGVAAHYSVPRHTAQSWLRTLRRKQAAGQH